MGKGKRWLAGALALGLGLGGVAGAGEAVQTYDYGTTEYGESLEPQRIVVTASRIPTPVENVAEPITVFTGSQPGGSVNRDGANNAVSGQNAYAAGNFETRQYRSILDVMQQTPGVSYYDSGGEGTTSGLFMRGMESGNTRVFIDGMPVNDPSTPNGMFDFGIGSLDNIGQLEVLRGPQSTLYGSSATGGVVNLTSMKGEGPAKGFASIEAGSRGTVRTRFGSSAGNDKADYSFAGSVFHTDGHSRMDKRLGATEKDSFEYGSFNVRLGANPTDYLRFDLFANGVKGEVEFDSSDPATWAFADDDAKTKFERYMIRPQATLTLFDGRWEQKAGFGYMKTRRRNFGYEDIAFAASRRSKIEGETLRFDYQSLIRLHETNTLLAGVDVDVESMKSTVPWYGAMPGTRPEVFDPDSVRTTSFYLEDQINFRDVFFASAGVRHIDHETFGNKTVWKSSAMFVLPSQTRLKASAGTGFKAPTLSQLYDDTYGSNNPNLKAERTFGWDAGLEQSLFCDRVVFGSTYFRNVVKDGITSGPAPTYTLLNINKYRTWGIESFANILLTENLKLSLQHTWTRTEREDTRRELVRRPKNSFSVNVDWQFLEKGTFTAGIRHVGTRLDWDNSKMSSYTIARVGAAWKFNDHFEVFGRVENLFNKKYQVIRDYGTERIGFFGGLTMSF